MSDFRFRGLEKYQTGGTSDRMELSIPLPTTESGKTYRLCSNDFCVPRLFLLADNGQKHELTENEKQLIRTKPGSQGITCPYCGLDAEDQDFFHPKDIQAIQKYVEYLAVNDIGKHLEGMAIDFNRKMKRTSGIISIQMDVKKSRLSRPYVWREDLLRNLACDICGRDYGVYAIGLMCPDCGSPNIHVHFNRELELIEKQIDLASNAEEKDQELAYRLLGNAHEDVLTALETYLKAIYKYIAIQRLPKEEAEILVGKKSIGNAFQNIEKGQELFKKFGIDPYKHLPETDIELLKLNIDKRHVVGHNLSIADEAYSTSEDKEDPGTTVTLLSDEMTKFGEICFSVVKELENEIVPKDK